jgi:transposase, IS6 family
MALSYIGRSAGIAGKGKLTPVVSRHRREGAYRTIQGYEALHAIQKGQARWVGVGQIVRQRHFIFWLFQIAI